MASSKAERTIESLVVLVADSNAYTRKLTRLLREKGAQNGCLMAGDIDEARALAEARAFPGLAGMDLAKVVTTGTPYEWSDGAWELGRGFRKPAEARPRARS